MLAASARSGPQAVVRKGTPHNPPKASMGAAVNVHDPGLTFGN